MNRIELIEKSLNDVGISIYNEDKTVKTIEEVVNELSKVWTEDINVNKK